MSAEKLDFSEPKTHLAPDSKEDKYWDIKLPLVSFKLQYQVAERMGVNHEQLTDWLKDNGESFRAVMESGNFQSLMTERTRESWESAVQMLLAVAKQPVIETQESAKAA
jgi:hypothetical protein